MLPDLFWVGVGIYSLGEQKGDYRQAAREVRDLTRWMDERQGRKGTTCVVMASAWNKVSEEDKEAAKREARKGRWKLLSRGAELMRRKFGEGETACLSSGGEDEQNPEIEAEDWNTLLLAMNKAEQKESRLGVFLRGILMIWEIESGTLKIAKDSGFNASAFDAAMEDPSTELGALGASSLRAHVLATFPMLAERYTIGDWANRMWNISRRETKCLYKGEGLERPTAPPWDVETFNKFATVQSATVGFIKQADEYLANLLSEGGRHEENDFRSVAEALVGRAGSLFIGLGISPLSWTGTTAPLALRAMIEAYIDLKYITQEPQERAAKYIEHGLGQEKQALHSLEQSAEKKRRSEDLEAMIKERIRMGEGLINERQAEWATDIIRESWAGNTLRARAIAVDETNLYTLAYQQWSGPMHNAWTHLVRYNSDRCINPLHRQHWSGKAIGFWEEWHPDYMFRACLYLEKITDLFAEEFGCKSGGARIRKAFTEIAEEHLEEWLTQSEKETI